MSCIYGPRQMGTEDQGWVAHFLIRALRGEPISIYGDGRQVRDVLYVADAIEPIRAPGGASTPSLAGLQPRRRSGECGESPPSARAASRRHRPARRGCHSEWRAGDQRWYVSDTRRAAQELGLRPRCHGAGRARAGATGSPRGRAPVPAMPQTVEAMQ